MKINRRKSSYLIWLNHGSKSLPSSLVGVRSNGLNMISNSFSSSTLFISGLRANGSSSGDASRAKRRDLNLRESCRVRILVPGPLETGPQSFSSSNSSSLKGNILEINMSKLGSGRKWRLLGNFVRQTGHSLLFLERAEMIHSRQNRWRHPMTVTVLDCNLRQMGHWNSSRRHSGEGPSVWHDLWSLLVAYDPLRIPLIPTVPYCHHCWCERPSRMSTKEMTRQVDSAALDLQEGFWDLSPITPSGDQE